MLSKRSQVENKPMIKQNNKWAPKNIYYMANPVLGKSLCSDWFFLGQDFAVRTVSMETVQFVYFCFGAKPANSKFATKTAKKCENEDEEDKHFLSASHRKCILLSGTECHIINYLLTELVRAVPGNIGPRSFSYEPRCARSGSRSLTWSWTPRAPRKAYLSFYHHQRTTVL